MTSRYTDQVLAEVALMLRRELLRLARLEESLAAEEAARTPYRAPLPTSVGGRRAAAIAPRAEADRLLERAPLEAAPTGTRNDPVATTAR